MPQIELTDKFCRAAKVTGGAKVDYFDTTVKGLCLRVSAAGGKTWHAVYSKPNGKRAWLKLGRYPEMALGGDTGARQRARDARAKVSEGGDPVADKKALAAAMTVADLVDNYAARHAVTRRSGVETVRTLRTDVVPLIGQLKLADLHRRDVQRCLDAVRDRGAPIAANRLFANMRAMLRWAHARGDLDSNIVAAMRQPAPTSPARSRVLSPDEIRTVWAALASADMRESTRRILRLCLVTAQRVGEVAGMARAELDLERATWTIPAERAKNGREHVVPLSDLALAILRDQISAVDSLSKRKRRPAPAFIFPAPGGDDSVTGASVAHAVRGETTQTDDGGSLVMGAPHWTPHDLRRTAATLMEESGVSPFIIGHVLNHVSATKATVTSRVYARYDYAKEKREALDLWAARLGAILKGGAEVVPLRRGAPT